MIRSTRHNLTYANAGKRSLVREFISEYRRVAGIILDDMWNNGYSWNTPEGELTFNVSQNKLDHPRYIDYSGFDIETTLSARALSSLVTQLCGVIGASVEKQRKRLYQYETTPSEALAEAIAENAPVKPDISRLNPELSSKCADIQKADGEFEYFLRLKSIGSCFGHINLPLKAHLHSRKFKVWTLKNSFLITENYVNLRWEKESVLKQEGTTVGCDQGLKDVVTLSDGTTSPKRNKHGKSLDSITLALSKCKKNSKRFHRKQDERKNFINWSVNQLNLTDIRQINLEEIANICYKKHTSRLLRHWTNTLIRDKIIRKCEELGVRVQMQKSTYRSQRCSCCGVVRKSQRKGKVYKCRECGLEIDSDLNAALNHEIDLPDIPIDLCREKRNRKGFYWLPEGFFDLSRVELRVPLTENQVCNV